MTIYLECAKLTNPWSYLSCSEFGDFEWVESFDFYVDYLVGLKTMCQSGSKPMQLVEISREIKMSFICANPSRSCFNCCMR